VVCHALVQYLEDNAEVLVRLVIVLLDVVHLPFLGGGQQKVKGKVSFVLRHAFAQPALVCISLIQCAIARTKPVEVKGKHVAVLRRKLGRHHREFGGYFLVGIQTDDHPIARRERHEVVRPVCVCVWLCVCVCVVACVVCGCVCVWKRESESESARGGVPGGAVAKTALDATITSTKRPSKAKYGKKKPENGQAAEPHQCCTTCDNAFAVRS
jgi:hypothetical protein